METEVHYDFHPDHENVGIFNGLGTKGVTLAPHFARHIADYLLNKSVIDKEVAKPSKFTGL